MAKWLTWNSDLVNRPAHEVVDGVSYLHVTHVLDAWVEPWILEWKLDVGRVQANKTGRKAMAIGTRVDELIKRDVIDKKYSLRKSDLKEVESCMKGWEKFKSEHPMTMTVGTRYHSKVNYTTGEPDLLCVDTLLDVKCSSQIEAKHWLQTGTYNRDSQILLPKIAILRLDKFWGTYEFKTRPYNDAYGKIFDGILAAYRYFEIKGAVI